MKSTQGPHSRVVRTGSRARLPDFALMGCATLGKCLNLSVLPFSSIVKCG